MIAVYILIGIAIGAAVIYFVMNAKQTRLTVEIAKKETEMALLAQQRIEESKVSVVPCSGCQKAADHCQRQNKSDQFLFHIVLLGENRLNKLKIMHREYFVNYDFHSFW